MGEGAAKSESLSLSFLFSCYFPIQRRILVAGGCTMGIGAAYFLKHRLGLDQ